MKVSTITLAAALVLSSTYAMAQSSGNSSAEMVASPATRSAMNSVRRMNSMHRRHHHHGWSASRYNGHGINDLGVTTNQGRKNNGG
jgi:hypothetical protein